MTSSSSSSLHRIQKNPNSPLWKYVEVGTQIPGGGGFNWTCKQCDQKHGSSYYRVKAHLCHYTGHGIGLCPGRNGVPLSRETIATFRQEQEDADNRSGSKTKQTSQKRSQAMPPPASSNIVVENHPFLATPPSEQTEPGSTKRQKGPLEQAFQNEKRELADRHIGRCIYANGLAFNLVRSPYWKDMIKYVNEAPPGYKSPGFEKVRGTLLDKEVSMVEDSLKPIRDSWVETGVSIVSDGWKDSRNRPLINVIAVSPKGAMFLKAVDCEGQLKDGQFIANILIEAIEQVGPRNVVQVITDNAKNCKAAGLLVEERYEHIFWTPCAVHSLNLMLKKIGNKIDWIKQVYEEAEDIQMFITNHHMSQGIFRSFSKLELLKVAETRFASNTIVLRRLVRVKEALCSMVISQNWVIWKQSSSERASAIRQRILDDSWWDRVEYLLSFTEPIMSMIRYTDMDCPCIGEVYDGIDSMLEKMKGIINAKEQDPEETFFKQVQTIVEERWNKMTTPLHLLAFALSPKYYSSEILSLPGRLAPYRDFEVSEGYKKAFKRLFPEPDLLDVVTNEFIDFVHSNGQSIEALRDKYKRDAHGWWYYHGQQFRQLQPLAIKVLSQVASSSASERNWSTYSFIHSVKRNRLGSKKAENLVYVHSNLRLISHKQVEYKSGESKMWDHNPEDTDLEAPASNYLAIDDHAFEENENETIGQPSNSATASASDGATGCGSSNVPETSHATNDEEDDYAFLENPFDE